MIFCIENLIWILAVLNKAAKLGKTPGDAYNRGGWLRPFEWVAEGVVFYPYDFSIYLVSMPRHYTTGAS